ncbi:MAG: DUF1631 family protein, partial [Burkholderiaceae bacterium]
MYGSRSTRSNARRTWIVVLIVRISCFSAASSAHPARKLIDRIAGTSAGWEPYGDDNARYLKEVDRVVTDILKNFETDITVFERLYGEFDKFVSDITPEDSDPVS